MRCVIVCPTYNELDSISTLLDDVGTVRHQLGRHGGHDLHVLVVDDASPDGTQEAVRAHPGHTTSSPARATSLAAAP